MMQRIFELLPKWTTLSNFGKLSVFKTSYFWILFVPLVAKLFEDLNEKISINLFGFLWNLNLSLPFSWQIFYFSSVAISLAMLLYSIKCPEIIKKYSSYTDFNNDGKTRYQVREYFIEYINNEKITADLRYRIALFLQEFCAIDALSIKNMKLDQMENSRDLVKHVFKHDVQKGKNMDSFWYVQDSSNSSFPFYRLVCLALFLIGFILITIVFIQNFIYVYEAIK